MQLASGGTTAQTGAAQVQNRSLRLPGLDRGVPAPGERHGAWRKTSFPTAGFGEHRWAFASTKAERVKL